MKPVYDEEEKQNNDTEITLGMSSLLGIFFGAVLICGVFFGFGYSMGRGNARAAAPAKVTLGGSASTAAARPSIRSDAAGSESTPTPAAPLQTVASNESSAASSAPQPTASSVKQPANQSPGQSEDQPGETSSRQPALTAGNPPARPKTSPATAAKPTSTPPPAYKSGPLTSASAAPSAATQPPGQPVMVQIAAVANQEDAGILVSALKKRGYTVTVHTEPSDKLLHIQLGPFASRDEAKAMRTKLLADGYNAILK